MKPQTTQTAAHSPLPWNEWNANKTRILKTWRINDANGKLVCTMGTVNDYTNAALIVRSVNSHAALVEALRVAYVALEKSVHFQSDLPFWRKGGDGHTAMLEARAALAAAELS